MKLWYPIKNEYYSRDASVLKIYIGEKILGSASCLSLRGYVARRAFCSINVCS